MCLLKLFLQSSWNIFLLTGTNMQISTITLTCVHTVRMSHVCGCGLLWLFQIFVKKNIFWQGEEYRQHNTLCHVTSAVPSVTFHLLFNPRKEHGRTTLPTRDKHRLCQ